MCSSRPHANCLPRKNEPSLSACAELPGACATPEAIVASRHALSWTSMRSLLLNEAVNAIKGPGSHPFVGSPMRAARRNEAWRRFAAALLAFALVIGNVIGGAAHALHRVGVHEQHGHAATVSAAVPGESSPDRGVPGNGAAGNHEALCLDVLCHGGLAVVPAVDAVAVSKQVVSRDEPLDVGGTGTTPVPLDRPPSIPRS